MESTTTNPAAGAPVEREPGEELARLADFAWSNKRLWWLAWAFPFPLYLVASAEHLSDDHPLGFALRHWPILGELYLEEEAVAVLPVLIGSLFLRSRVGTALAGFAQSTRAGGAPRGLFQFAERSWKSAMPLLLARFLLGSVTLSLLLLPTQLLMDRSDSITEPLVFLRVAPFYLLALGYGLTLDACTQLGIQSVAANDRGAASAFQHGWRLLGAFPWRAARWVGGWGALLVGYGLFGVVILGETFGELGLLAFLLTVPFFGTFSAFYWAEAYHRLGGLRTLPLERL